MLAELAGAGDSPVATADGWHELPVANPTFLLDRRGSECTDLQGLRKRRFAPDAELARQLINVQRRLRDANERLWSGLNRDGIAATYGEHPAAIESAAAHDRSEILGARAPLPEAQRAHRTIHHSSIAYQDAAERRRRLAAEVGELIALLVAAGWSGHDAREAPVRDLAATRTCASRSPWRTDGCQPR